MNARTPKADNEALSISQRWLEASFDIPMLLLFGFFAYHQLRQTGFFTARFGPVEMICLYGPIVVSLVAPIVRAVAGRRNPARPLDIATYMSLALGSLWLLIVFPFDFSHLADVLPGAIRFVIAWITNDIGRLVLALQVFIGPVSSLLTAWRYLPIRRRTSVTPPQQPIS